MYRHVVAVTAAGMLTACGAPSPPVPVGGTTADLASLAGEWSGEYSSIESGRSGSIVFRLKAGTDSATGDVMMSAMTAGPRGEDPGPPDVAAHVDPLHPTTAPAHVIPISFVRIAGGLVSGRLDSYIEPTCNCSLSTVFEGRLSGDRLEGSYLTTLPDGKVQHGRWAVMRKR